MSAERRAVDDDRVLVVAEVARGGPVHRTGDQVAPVDHRRFHVHLPAPVLDLDLDTRGAQQLVLGISVLGPGRVEDHPHLHAALLGRDEVFDDALVSQEEHCDVDTFVGLLEEWPDRSADRRVLG